jgi:6-phosphogluconate dehydrogenase
MHEGRKAVSKATGWEMQIAVIGLGRMGANIARRLARGGHQVFVYDRSPEKAPVLAREDRQITAASTLAGLVKALSKPRHLWVMVPAGKATDAVIRELSKVLSRGDVIIDGGNSNFQESMARAKALGRRGIHFVDAGTSGGIHGLKEGYSLMVGGEKTVVDRLRPVFETLAPSPKRGWGHVGPAGSGHFVKMVHNGIEYGLMQAYAEGFEILKARKDFNLDLHQVAGIWRAGSIVRSKLLDLIAESLAEDQELSGIKGWVDDSGEGRWTAFEAINENVPAPVITLALMMRFVSRQDESYAAKLLAAMRNKFGGHPVKTVTGD